MYAYRRCCRNEPGPRTQDLCTMVTCITFCCAVPFHGHVEGIGCNYPKIAMSGRTSIAVPTAPEVVAPSMSDWNRNKVQEASSKSLL